MIFLRFAPCHPLGWGDNGARWKCRVFLVIKITTIIIRSRHLVLQSLGTYWCEKIQFGPSMINWFNHTPISFKLLIVCNCIPIKISTTTLNLRAFFLLWSLAFNLCDLNLNRFQCDPSFAQLAWKNSTGFSKIPIFSIESKLNSRTWFLID